MMLAKNKQLRERHIKWIIDRITDFLFSRKSCRKYTCRFVDRVQAVFNKHGEEGCVHSDFVPHFKLDEADLLDFTLHTLWSRNLIKREVRYFLRTTK